MTIVVTGGAGFIGKNLLESLLGDGYTVIVVDRVAPNRIHPKLFFIQCDITATPLPYNILEHTDAVINLVGEPIAGAWTPEKMTLIKESRIKSTQHIVESIAATKSRPGVFINASAIGFYGDTADEVVDEQGPVGTDFLAEVVASWEAVARTAIDYGVRVVCVRTAPVLGKGGILKLTTKTSPFGFLVKTTKTNPWFSWIHISDIVGVYRFALETTTLQGVVNASAPEPVLYQTFMSTLSAVIHRPITITAPLWLLTIFYKGMSTEFTKSSRVVPRRLVDKGYVFKYPTIEEALRDITNKVY
ncbi:TIGR01777 family oxidoreductase [Patescibacteria group bacterium]|nr:TIGR01777 family oxidoreductase [Patescibacteria group bacterium]